MDKLQSFSNGSLYSPNTSIPNILHICIMKKLVKRMIHIEVNDIKFISMYNKMYKPLNRDF